MTNHFIIAVSVADIRREPDSASELVTQALLNVPVEAGESAGDWTYVTLSDYQGWTLSSQLAEPIVRGYCEGEGTCGVPLPYSVVVTVPHTPLYSTAEGTQTKGEIYLSTVLPYIDLTHPQRLRVALPDDEEAWLERSAVEVRSNFELFPPRPLADVFSHAHAFLERPYLWGGTSWRGLDCSGFVQLCYRMGGVILPRDAYQQQAFLPHSVAPAEIQAGDLLFFGHEHVTHVALALDATTYIHAEGQEYQRVLRNSLDPVSSLYNHRLAVLVHSIKRVPRQE